MRSVKRTSLTRPSSTRSRPSSMDFAMALSAADAKTRSLNPRLEASDEPRRATGRLGFTGSSLPVPPEELMSAMARRRPAIRRSGEWLAPPVQGDDPEGEVAPRHVLVARLADPCSQGVLVGPRVDRLVEVVVGVVVRARELHKRRHDVALV